MIGLVTAAEQALVTRLVANSISFSQGSRVTHILLGFAGFFVFLALCLLVLAAYLWLSQNATPEIAAAVAAGLSLVMAAALLLGAYMVTRFRFRQLRQIKKEVTEIIHAVLDLVDEEIREPVEENPKTAVLLASAAGFLAGDRIF